MSKLQILGVIFSVILLSLGQILFKLTSKDLVLSFPAFFQSLLNMNLFFALLIYFLATILWLIILNTTPLKWSYPFLALTFIIVPIMSNFLLNETLSSNTFLGAFFIIIGVLFSIQ